MVKRSPWLILLPPLPFLPLRSPSIPFLSILSPWFPFSFLSLPSTVDVTSSSDQLPAFSEPTSEQVNLVSRPLSCPLDTSRLPNILPPLTPLSFHPFFTPTPPPPPPLPPPHPPPPPFPLLSPPPLSTSPLLHPSLPSHARTHPERSNLVIRPLGCPLDTSRLPNVFMGFFEPLPLRKPWPASFYGTPIKPGSDIPCVTSDSASADSASADSFTGETDWIKKLGCHGPPCPSFGSCTAHFPNVQACWNPHLVDEPEIEIAPPINCPLKRNSTALDRWRKGTGRAPFDETCSSRKDFTPHGASALQVMRLEDQAKYEAGHMVHELPAVFNLAHQPGDNFYHFLVELLPLFLVSAPLMPSTLRLLPVLLRHKQVRWYEQLGAPLIGIQADQIRLLPTYTNDLFHADVVYQPIYQDCDRPSRPLWRLLRRRHLLHPTGLPIFNPDWTFRSHRPLSLSEARAFPPNWVVVLAKRPEGQKRAMLNFREVEGEVVRRFGRERVVVYDGTLPILQARALLSRARFYVAAHGAALTNMVFMPERSSVLEIRPEASEVTVFNFLASACSLRYHLVFTKGDSSSSIVANVTSVARVLDSVRARMRKEDERSSGA
ncbi:unnamed protein product [Closterium sp. Naga37s-1]|nr:unnamed protein product [Closterium sp. Naga37s-1]